MGLFDRIRPKTAQQQPTPRRESAGAEEEATGLIIEGNALEDAGCPGEALQRYDAAARLAPRSARAHLNRGNAMLAMGDIDSALRAYTEALVHDPDHAPAHYNLGNAQFRAGRHDAALASYRRALALRPDFADAEVALGALQEVLGQPGEAVASYRRALRINPDYVQVHGSLGGVLQQQGQLEEAVASYRQALASAPADAVIHYNMGNALRDLGRLDECVASLRQAVAIRPDLVAAHYNLGNAQRDMGDDQDAIASYRQALRLDSRHVNAHCNLGNLLKDDGRVHEALECYRRMLEIEPRNVIAHNNIGNAQKELGQMEEALTSYQQALELSPDSALARSNLLFIHNYLSDLQPGALLAEARHFGERATRQARPFSAWSNAPDPDRALRVGFVSGDLRSHPVGYFTESVFAALAVQASRSVEIHVYATHSAADAVTARIKASCHGWHAVANMPDEDLAQQIRRDGIDILIDLSGHTADNRLTMFAWKPAPVQASWLGYFATTGVPAMDYLIADPWTLPESEEVNFTERIWRLPESRLCFTPPDDDVAVASPPVQANGFITFGCFNHLTKMNEGVVALWSQVLAAVPGSRLALKAKPLQEAAVRQRVGERFAVHGIAADRLILEGTVPRADYLAAYHRVDIALDPFPYTGGTTTVEALWMGVPVLTLAGGRFLSRQGAGILANVGLPDWIAADSDDYVARAVLHSGDHSRLAALRGGLRQKLLASPIADAPRFASHFEAALRGMWRTWCTRPRRDERGGT